MSDASGDILAAVLTLAIFSFLYRDNPVYKAAEHLFVGLAAGYFLALQYRQVFLPNVWNPLYGEGELLQIIPLALALLLFLRLIPRVAWLSRWSMGVLIGAFSGLQVIGFAQGDLVNQIGASVLSLNTGDAWESVKNGILVVGLLSSLFYFFFSTEHKGTAGAVAKLGIWFLMISFGASYGFTVMARISLLIGRLQFLFYEVPGSVGSLF